MLFYSTLFSIAGFLSLQSAVHALTIPNDSYMISRFENETRVYQSLTDSSLPAIIATKDDLDSSSSTPDLSIRSAKFPRSTLTKRRTDCWGYQLTPSGIDASARGLEEICGNGRDVESPADRNVYFGLVSEGMLVYYCLNQSGKKANCDKNDVSYALAQMDARCKRYEASWFGWPGSFEIIGKAKVTDSVCNGGMNGKPWA